MRAAAADIVAGVLLCGVAAALWIGAGYIQTRTRGFMGPVAFPEGVALLLGGCSLLMIGRAAVHWRAPERVGLERPESVLAAMVLVALYPVLIEHLGFYPATGIWLVPLLWVAGCRGPLVIGGCAIGFLVFTKLVFEMLLGTPLP